MLDDFHLCYLTFDLIAVINKLFKSLEINEEEELERCHTFSEIWFHLF